MPALYDHHGLAVSTPDAAAVDAFERALAALHGARGSADPHVDEALRRDPSCVIARCLRATASLLASDRARDPQVETEIAALDRCLRHANGRERAHVAALRAWQRGKPRVALALYDRLLAEHPCDGLALRSAHALDFRLGQREILRERIARVLPHWRPSRNVAPQLGVRVPQCLASRTLSPRTGRARCRARHSRRRAAKRANERDIDASALLWRLSLREVDVGSRFRALADAWRGRMLRGARAFTLAHAVMALAAAGDDAGARDVAALLREDRITRKANLAEDLALAVPLCEALRAFAGADYRRAVERLSTVRARAEQCGGSIAQCDLLHLTLVESALRSRHVPLARALTAERKARRPASRLDRWLFARAALVTAT